ncbi:MAG TPA: hypothetical protein VNG35_01270 [Gemmatimonadales bacterium]|nr:hypothetical protein [Gemmatimonadales bacterium]
MDRARHPRVARAGIGTPGERTPAPTPFGGGALRGARWAALAASAVIAGAACKALSPDFDAVIAIDVALPDSVIDIGDTTHPRGAAINGRGDSTPATLVWTALDTTIRVVDSLSGTAVGVSPGPGRLVARIGALSSNPAVVNVLGTLDSIVAVGITADTVTVSKPDSLSGPLTIEAFSGGTATAFRRIALSVDFPPGGTGITLVPGDTIVTGPQGTASFQVRLTGVRPDSAAITASATYHGAAVPGSPHFVVVFQP